MTAPAELTLPAVALAGMAVLLAAANGYGKAYSP